MNFLHITVLIDCTVAQKTARFLLSRYCKCTLDISIADCNEAANTCGILRSQQRLCGYKFIACVLRTVIYGHIEQFKSRQGMIRHQPRAGVRGKQNKHKIQPPQGATLFIITNRHEGTKENHK